MVPIQQTCQIALCHYLSVRKHKHPDDLWVTRKHERLLRRGIMDMLKSCMIQAGITDIYGSTHIFRHTRAKFYILNGGDAFKPCNKYLGIARWIWYVIMSDCSGQRFSSNTESLAQWSNMRIFRSLLFMQNKEPTLRVPCFFGKELHLVSNSAINLSKSRFFIFFPQQNLYFSPLPHGHKS